MDSTSHRMAPPPLNNTIDPAATARFQEVCATLKDSDGKTVEVPPGNLADPPSSIQIRRDRVCVAFADPDMRGLVHDILATEYPWFASMTLMFVPSGRLSEPEKIEIVASAEVTCGIPTTMTGEQVAEELRAAVQQKTRERLEEVGQMIAEFGTGKGTLVHPVHGEIPVRLVHDDPQMKDGRGHSGHTMPPGATGIISDEYTESMPPDHIASPACWCGPIEGQPGLWTHRSDQLAQAKHPAPAGA